MYDQERVVEVSAESPVVIWLSSSAPSLSQSAFFPPLSGHSITAHEVQRADE